MPRKTTTKTKPKSTITLALPEEFIALCASDGVTPELVLRGFNDTARQVAELTLPEAFALRVASLPRSPSSRLAPRTR